MNRDQVHTMMTALAIGGSVVGGFIIAQHQVAEHTISIPTITPSSSGTPSASGTPSTSPSSGGKVTKTGDMIQGNDPFGDYAQIQVTKDNGKVTDVQVVQSYSNGGRETVFPYLSQQAVSSNGAQVANYSGATYTTVVFNEALASAMSKF